MGIWFGLSAFWCSMAHRMPDFGSDPFQEPEGVGERWQNNVDVLAVGELGMGPGGPLVSRLYALIGSGAFWGAFFRCCRIVKHVVVLAVVVMPIRGATPIALRIIDLG